MIGAIPGAKPEQQVYSVVQITRRVKERIEADPALRGIAVRGEVSNFKLHSSGHMYFTLKDASARLKCVMFRGRNARLVFRPENGMSVVAVGAIGVYESGGEYQLYVEDMHPAGQGDLFIAFEQLKRKLEAEGLFAADRKRELPFLPRTVGVITSPSGAAVRDIVSVLGRRFPGVRVLIAPAVVQGEAGPASVIGALRLMNRRDDVDVVIVGRGGGSLEELWTFNDEGVAREIVASGIPVVSAVGHETDFTIADFVADVRAPTPSAAAELVVPEQAQLLRQVVSLRERLAQSLVRRGTTLRQRLELLQASPALQRPLDRLNQRRQHIDDLLHRAGMAIGHRAQRRRRELAGVVGKLDTLSPLATLGRGYSLCRHEATGSLVRRAAQVAPGERVQVRVVDGRLHCRVEDVAPVAPAGEGVKGPSGGGA